MTPEHEAQLLKLNEEPIVEGWLTHEKACVLFRLVEEWKPEVCLEVGSFAGKSAMAIAMALKSIGKGIIFGIDPWLTSAAIEGTNSTEDNEWWKEVPWDRIAREYYDRMQQFDLLPFTAHFRKYDTDCLEYFEDLAVEFCHLDANHSAEISTRIVHSWWPKMAPGCVIVMDDILWSGQSQAAELLKTMGCVTLKEYETYAVYRKPNGRMD